MEIKMVGIDYQSASLAVRERFAMTKSVAEELMRRICIEYGASGCVLLSTCNRTELWLSGKGEPDEILCALIGVDPLQYRQYFTVREGREAIEHLFFLACGLKSQVLGEDQIITQIKNALLLSRGCGTADAVTEELFRTAVTAAKRVKTEVRLSGGECSVAISTVDFLEQRLGRLDGISCMVIGNGEMGRLAAAVLRAKGAAVWMTVRQYRHGEVVIPQGVNPIPYDSRIEQLAQVQAVISATASPHYTLSAAAVGRLPHPILFCDLAVPRDIDPCIALLEGASIYDTDDICKGSSTVVAQEKLAQVQKLLREYIDTLEQRNQFRTLVPYVNEISRTAAQDMIVRVERSVGRLVPAQEEQTALCARIQDAAQKTVGRMLFGLRENLAPELWERCIDGLQKSIEREEKR